jgi:hypothetical protein
VLNHWPCSSTFGGEGRHNDGAAVANIAADGIGTGSIHHKVGRNNKEFVVELSVRDVDERGVDVVFEEGLQRAVYLLTVTGSEVSAHAGGRTGGVRRDEAVKGVGKWATSGL